MGSYIKFTKRFRVMTEFSRNYKITLNLLNRD